ncbi:DNA mismatch repair protein MutS [Candidatus Woesearchaeota archaeon]|nr:DNA mismatch repair protein MutS [Candidatus Woesearchaeota archaeon]
MTDLTPGMRQYVQVKNQHPDCLVLFRMGDFYETFYEDAKTAARELEITLTSRGKGEKKAPLAGIPYHALEPYLAKLVKKGYKVCIVEQLEDPKQAKGLVKRGVTRIVTPGTVIESALLQERTNNYLMAILPYKSMFGVSFVDISTGEFLTTTCATNEELIDEITRFTPAEVIIPSSSLENNALMTLLKKYMFLSPYDDRFFLSETANQSLQNHFQVHSLGSFGLGEKHQEEELMIMASGALLCYLKETQRTNIAHITKVMVYNPHGFMLMDETTRKNLEILSNIRHGSAEHTLLHILDKTVTSLGARLLRQWLVKPLRGKVTIDERLEGVEELFSNILLRHELRSMLDQVSDIERLVSRIHCGNAHARDLLALQKSLLVIPELCKTLTNSHASLLRHIHEMTPSPEVVDLIQRAIQDDPPATVREGNVIKKGYHQELDNLRSLASGGKEFIAKLEQQERERTGIKSLKVGFNRVFGYYIEVTKANLQLVPSHYLRKQTQVNAERYITEELKEYEQQVLGAEEKIIQLEYELFVAVLEQIKPFTQPMQEAAQKIALLDVLIALAEVAATRNYVKPVIHEGYNLTITGGRHPMVEDVEPHFVPNDVLFDREKQIHIITGPNMAGKSVFMRQVCLIVLMAQIGSFVPARTASLGIVDRIFTRVGASDDVSSGQSTFMMEMTETANILNNATSNSLIILDEIGRGTSTFDGISLAWAIVEYIHGHLQAKTLFATHFHQLNSLEEKCANIKNYNIAVQEKEDDIIFLRKIVEGGTDKSYGIHAAKLAGIPLAVIQRAKEIMGRLDMNDQIAERIHQPLKLEKNVENLPDKAQEKLSSPSQKKKPAPQKIPNNDLLHFFSSE